MKIVSVDRFFNKFSFDIRGREWGEEVVGGEYGMRKVQEQKGLSVFQCWLEGGIFFLFLEEGMREKGVVAEIFVGLGSKNFR